MPSTDIFCKGGVGGRVAFSGVCPAIARLLRGGGDWAVVVHGGEMGISSIFKDGPSIVTELPRCGCDRLDLCGAGTGGRPGICMEVGAPFLRCDNGIMFSSSAIAGNFWLVLIAREVGEVMLLTLPPP